MRQNHSRCLKIIPHRAFLLTSLLPTCITCTTRSTDLSALVDSQDDDIENLQSLSIESMNHAQAGVRHLMRINRQREMKQRRTYLLLGLLMLVGAFWVFGARVEDTGDDAGNISYLRSP